MPEAMKDREKDEQLAEHLSRFTPARINVGKAGNRPRTSTWLQFRADHALAKDAVSSNFSERFLKTFAAQYELPVMETLAKSREEFLLNPPLGKKTSNDILDEIVKILPTGRDVLIVISDGLSSHAVEENLPDLYPMLLDGFDQSGITTSKGLVVKQGRVAIADQVAHALGARVALNLIGERPGLSTASSLSAYITYNPGPQTISSDRTVISNIHKGGTPAVEAGAFIVKTIARILEKKASGVRLQALG